MRVGMLEIKGGSGKRKRSEKVRERGREKEREKILRSLGIQMGKKDSGK